MGDMAFGEGHSKEVLRNGGTQGRDHENIPSDEACQLRMGMVFLRIYLAASRTSSGSSRTWFGARTIWAGGAALTESHPLASSAVNSFCTGPYCLRKLHLLSPQDRNLPSKRG